MLHKARMGPFEDSEGNEHWGIEIVDTDSIDSVDTGQGKAATPDAVSASESIELQTRKSLNTPDSSEGMNHGVHERLLGTSDTEVEAVVGAEGSLEDFGHAKQIGR